MKQLKKQLHQEAQAYMLFQSKEPWSRQNSWQLKGWAWNKNWLSFQSNIAAPAGLIQRKALKKRKKLNL